MATIDDDPPVTADGAALDLDRCLESGQLELLTADQSYLRTGRFSVDDMLELWGQSVTTALEAGGYDTALSAPVVADCAKASYASRNRSNVKWCVTNRPASTRALVRSRSRVGVEHVSTSPVVIVDVPLRELVQVEPHRSPARPVT